MDGCGILVLLAVSFASLYLNLLRYKLLPCTPDQNTGSDCITGNPKGQHVSCNFSVLLAAKEPESPPSYRGHLPGRRKREQDPPSCDRLPSICNAKICNKSHLSCTKPPYTEHFYRGPPNRQPTETYPEAVCRWEEKTWIRGALPGMPAEWF